MARLSHNGHPSHLRPRDHELQGLPLGRGGNAPRLGGRGLPDPSPSAGLGGAGLVRLVAGRHHRGADLPGGSGRLAHRRHWSVLPARRGSPYRAGWAAPRPLHHLDGPSLPRAVGAIGRRVRRVVPASPHRGRAGSELHRLQAVVAAREPARPARPHHGVPAAPGLPLLPIDRRARDRLHAGVAHHDDRSAEGMLVAGDVRPRRRSHSTSSPRSIAPPRRRIASPRTPPRRWAFPSGFRWRWAAATARARGWARA